MTDQLSRAGQPEGGYWYETEDRAALSDAVLNSLRAYRTAEAAMRKRTRDAMRMNENDLAAIRFLLESDRRGQAVSPTQLASRLQISTASVSILVDRLEKSGHLERRPNPNDGRGVVLVPTVATDAEVRHTLGDMHDRMKAVADGLSVEEAAGVTRFLSEMAASLDEIDREH